MFGYLFYPWGILLQVVALVHFVRRRPEGYWLYVILFLGGFGALVYLVVEALPDLSLLRGSYKIFPRRRRIREMRAVVAQNPAAGNYEELADLLFEDGQYAEARECYNRAISARTDHVDPFYRRALCAFALEDWEAARPDLELVVARDPRYDFHRAAGLLARSYALTGQTAQADALFPRVIAATTLTELRFYYADFLASQGRHAEAREIAQKIIASKALMPRFQRRADRPWFRRASALLKRVSASAS